MHKFPFQICKSIFLIFPFLMISWVAGCTLPPPPPPSPRPQTPPSQDPKHGQPDHTGQPAPAPQPAPRPTQVNKSVTPPSYVRPTKSKPPVAQPKRPSPDQKGDRPKPQSAQEPRIPTANGATQFAVGYIVQRFGGDALKVMLPLQAQMDGNGVWTVCGARPPQPGQKVSELRIDSRTGRLLSVK